jgi:hypothetical protein
MIEVLQLYAADDSESEVFGKIGQPTDIMSDYIIVSLKARGGTPTPQP